MAVQHTHNVPVPRSSRGGSTILIEGKGFLMYSYSYNTPVRFDGDIIITDPCYIISNDHDDDDWERCEYGDAMEELGLTNFLCASTIYGDWSCTTYNEKNDDVLGRFCADAGLVGVFLLEEVLKYNPKYDDIEKCPHAVTVIRDFHGEVEIACEVDEEDGEEVVVRGTGNINFCSRQTGF